MQIIDRIKEFDVYSKPLDDFRVRTFTGGAVTIVCGFVIILLFITETISFLSTEIDEQLYVDSTSAEQRIDINFDVEFAKLPCSLITVDVMDASGDNQQDIQHDLYKQRIDLNGNNISDDAIKQGVVFILSTFLCCNTCDDVKNAYNLRGWQIVDIESVEQCKSDSWVRKLEDYKNEGCRVYGTVQVAKVAGNFHVAPGNPLRTHRSHSPVKFDASHIIRHLSFGIDYPGKNYPLDGKSFVSSKGGIMFQYYLKIVPTIYKSLTSPNELFSHQFSVFMNQKDLSLGLSGLPGFFVQYEFSPLMVKYEEKRRSLSTFLVSLCAIIGGIFTVASLIDSFIYRSSRVLQRKIELSKHF
ncbi:unnamed protein product [Dracunculus medinensis]|uniref:Endoplasmic reticulum-Golgi intermediate compartment protein 3 n=1 Tax=Dracunculus medinensis TaxID=318479 RepID=A0A158Q4Q4_DRAME|nr:unnamed protein product [Dracunculus medinensis]